MLQDLESQIDKSRNRRDEKLQEKCKKGLSDFPYYIVGIMIWT
jgi:hypothetical protein